MEIFKSWKLFGLYFYVSDRRMKRRRSIDEKLRNQHKTLKKRKLLLYKEQDGCCASCGKHYGTGSLEIHHLVGVRENPGLALVAKNMVLLCHECHVRVHHRGPTLHQDGGTGRENGNQV